MDQNGYCITKWCQILKDQNEGERKEAEIKEVQRSNNKSSDVNVKDSEI